MRRTPALLLATSAVVALSAGCADNLPSTALVDKLRVIAVRAEPPEGAPGTSVHLDTLTIDPKQSLRELEHVWLVCVPSPGQMPQSCLDGSFGGSTAPVLCLVDPEARLCLASVDPTADYRLPERALTGRAEGESGQVIITHAVAQRGLLTACFENFRDEGIPSEECHVSIKRLVVARAGTTNKNPGLRMLSLDDMPLPEVTAGPEVLIESEHMLAVELIEGSLETLPKPAVDGSTTEQLFLSWYTTAGEIDTARTEPTMLMNKWIAPTRTAPVRIIVVAHDGRGGVGWTQGQVRISAP